jgi:hypothetical protein
VDDVNDHDQGQGAAGENTVLRDYTPAHRPPLTIPSKTFWGRLDFACYLVAAAWILPTMFAVYHWYPILNRYLNGQATTFIAMVIIGAPAFFLAHEFHRRDIQTRDLFRIATSLAGTLHALTTPGRTATGIVQAEPRQRVHQHIHVLQNERRNSGKALR